MAGRSFVRISSLLWADILVGYAFFVMQNYLTEVWGLGFTHSAAIVNLWGGACLILPVVLLFLVDAFVGNFMMLVLSSVAYSVGIALVAMSTPPVLANSTGTCTQYKPECIGHTQKLIFYIGMPLVALGLAGHQVSVRPFLEEQDIPQGEKSLWQLLGLCLVVIIPIIGAIAIPHIKPWSVRFGIPAICTIFTTILFLSGSCSYKMEESQGTSEEVKFAARKIPFWITLIICGMVSSTGTTYFVEQANHMNRKLGAWNVPAPVLLLLYKWAKKVFEKLAKWLLSKSKTYAPSVGIAVAMIFSILCCITAARFETRRLNVMRSHSLSDKTVKEIPMSVFWLLFQYFLLAGMDAFLGKSVPAMYGYQSPISKRNYFSYFAKGVSGFGFMTSMLSVYVVGRIKQNWFRFTLNRSRLDKYYWFLAALCSINLVVYILQTLFCRCKNHVLEDEVAIDGRGQVIDDGDGCACF